MDKLLAVIRREYVERVRSKWFLVATLLGPVFFGLITIVPAVMASRAGVSKHATNIVILDATGTDLGARVKAALTPGVQGADTAEAAVVAVPAGGLARAEQAAAAQVVAKVKNGYLVLDSASLGADSVRYLGRNASSQPDMEALRGAVRQAVLSRRLETAGLDPQRIAALTRVRTRLAAEVLDERGKGGSGIGSLIAGWLIALLLYMMIAIYGQNIMRGVLEEKTTRVAEVVVASVKPDILLAGKVIGVGGVGITQQLVWIVMALGMNKVREPILKAFDAPAFSLTLPHISPGMIALLLAFYILGYAFYASLFAAVGAMVSNQEDVQQASLPVTMLLVCSIIFMQPILLQPNTTLARVMTMLPFSAPILMPMRMSSVQVPAWEIATALGSTALACVAATWLSARIYRVGLLMYGKRPSFSELIRWVRYSA